MRVIPINLIDLFNCISESELSEDSSDDAKDREARASQPVANNAEDREEPMASAVANDAEGELIPKPTKWADYRTWPQIPGIAIEDIPELRVS